MMDREEPYHKPATKLLDNLVHDDRFMQWTWPDVEPYYRELEAVILSESTLEAFLLGWAALSDRVQELRARLHVATTRDTADAAAKGRYDSFLTEIFPHSEHAQQRLRLKFLTSGLERDTLRIALRDMRTDVALFREANLPLFAQEQELATHYHKIVGAHVVRWEGKEIPADQLGRVYQEQDRGRREQAWRLRYTRWMANREEINDLWRTLLALRLQQATNAGFADYRSFRWQQLKRFDYTPSDCLRFHRAIEEVIVPIADAMYEQRRRRLDVETLRPWDLYVNPLGQQPLRPFNTVDDLTSTLVRVFGRVDPTFGAYFEIMQREGLLDLELRPNKAAASYCARLPATKRSFIFMRAQGLHRDVQSLLHEGGHAFHDREALRLPYTSLHGFPGSEFAEVASMGMEVLAAPYLTVTEGGFYSQSDAARAKVEHLETFLIMWPRIAMIDAFQMWVYEHPAAAADPNQCDAQWVALEQRFMPSIDWSGVEQEQHTGWQRLNHIYTNPFYYIEYAIARLGALQLWANTQRDPAGTATAYRAALALGNTVPLPELFSTAGIRFAFDTATLRDALNTVQEMIASLGQG
jgi:oligoendopeptidase F